MDATNPRKRQTEIIDDADVAGYVKAYAEAMAPKKRKMNPLPPGVSIFGKREKKKVVPPPNGKPPYAGTARPKSAIQKDAGELPRNMANTTIENKSEQRVGVNTNRKMAVPTSLKAKQAARATAAANTVAQEENKNGRTNKDVPMKKIVVLKKPVPTSLSAAANATSGKVVQEQPKKRAVTKDISMKKTEVVKKAVPTSLSEASKSGYALQENPKKRAATKDTSMKKTEVIKKAVPTSLSEAANATLGNGVQENPKKCVASKDAGKTTSVKKAGPTSMSAAANATLGNGVQENPKKRAAIKDTGKATGVKKPRAAPSKPAQKQVIKAKKDIEEKEYKKLIAEIEMGLGENSSDEETSEHTSKHGAAGTTNTAYLRVHQVRVAAGLNAPPQTPFLKPGVHGWDWENHKAQFAGDPDLHTGVGHQVEPEDQERLDREPEFHAEFYNKYPGRFANTWPCGCQKPCDDEESEAE